MQDTSPFANHKETARQRASRDTNACLHHTLFWFAEFVVGFGVGIVLGPLEGFIFVLVLFVAIYVHSVATAPYKQRNEARVDLFRVVSQHEEYVQSITEALPKIVPKEPGAAHIVEVVFYDERNQVVWNGPFARLRVVNDPEHQQPGCKAENIMAKLSFFRMDGELELAIDGRWSESEQPGHRATHESRTDLLRTTLDIGDERSVDVAFMDLYTADLYAYNNDSYRFPKARNPDFKLRGKEYVVHIRFRGVNVDATFKMHVGVVDNELVILGYT